MIVWIVEEHIEYEGSGVKGVYENEDHAKVFAHELWERKRRSADRITVSRWLLNDPTASVLTFQLQHEKRPYLKPAAPTPLPSETSTSYEKDAAGNVTKKNGRDDAE